MLFIFLALFFYAIAVLIGTSANRNANTNLVTAVVNTVSAIAPLIVAVPLLSKKALVSQKYGLIMAVLGGLAIAAFTLAFNKSLSLNRVGIVVPVVYGGTIFLTTIASYFLFGEKLSQVELLGFTFLLIGFGVIIYARATAL